ncbi:uncharacterized protein [Procambarus clarkii]|uniref:uncharacterized protein n=1 Tax=Procambarus clarkii TaxID=6728 RepID=UPI001E677243|nr:uncharacterized protein LOC123763925 [Procambarus clarkii]
MQWLSQVTLWGYLVTLLATGLVDAARHSHTDTLSRSSGLNDLLDRLDSSIQEKNRRLQRGLSAFQYQLENEREMNTLDDDEPTIVQQQESQEEMTHTEDTSDYVNAAPWTRKDRLSGPVLADHDLHFIKLASENAWWVDANGRCKTPLRRCVAVVPPQHESPGIRYWPRCALLHRCGDDAGCCNSVDSTCAVAHSENVQLYFYAFGSDRAGVQMLTFANHTRCTCKPRSAVTTIQPTNHECKCPRPFSPEVRAGQCTCDCDNGKSKCRRLKRGRGYFSSPEVSCVSRGECTEPTCEHGPFLLKEKRCTKRRERERYTTERK